MLMTATRHQPLLARFGPGWFTSVMGTGIVANAAVTLPWQPPGLRASALAVWVLAAVLLVVVTATTVAHWVRHPDEARGWIHDPVAAHAYGAPAMGLITVGAGALLVGRPVLGASAVAVAAVLWTAGTLLGLWTAVAIPFRAITEHVTEPGSASGAWLMPVVPPMVSAATGSLLLPHLPAGQARLTMLLACYAMFGLTLVASLLVTSTIWSRLVHHGLGPAATVPTLWIVLGFLGQSVTAAHHLGAAAAGVVPAPYDGALEALALVYGVPVWGFAMAWLALVVAITVRTAREGLPFSLTWWSFTFPLGTVVTGTSGLADASGAVVLAVVAVLLYAGLLVAWATVATRTVRGLVLRTL